MYLLMGTPFLYRKIVNKLIEELISTIMVIIMQAATSAP